MGRSKKYTPDYSDLERFPIRETLCDFGELDKLRCRFVYIRVLGANIILYNKKMKQCMSFSNYDLFRINAPYFGDMEGYKNTIQRILLEKKVSFEDLLF